MTMSMKCKTLLWTVAAFMALAAVSCEKVQTEGPDQENPAPETNIFTLDGQTGVFESVVVSNIGEYICIAASTSDGVDIFEEIFDQEEYFYMAISPLLNGKEFDMKSEERLYTVIGTVGGAFLESVTPETTQEILSGTGLFHCKDGQVNVNVDLVLADGAKLTVKLTAEEAGIVVNENLFSIAGDDKPIRTSFSKFDNGTTAIYLTPAGIDYFADLEIATYYAYVILDDSKCHGKTLNVEDVIAVGYADNLKGLVVDSKEVPTTGTINVASDPENPAHFTVSADLDFDGTSLQLRFDGNTRDANIVEVKESKITYEGKPLGIKKVTLDRHTDVEGVYHVLITTERDDVICVSLPSNFLDGNAHGFSQSPDLYIEYDGAVYSKAKGSSGTVSVGVADGVMKVEVTNYKNLEVLYEGPYEELGLA